MLEAPGTADAGNLSATQSAGVSQRVRQYLWSEWRSGGGVELIFKMDKFCLPENQSKSVRM